MKLFLKKIKTIISYIITPIILIAMIYWSWANRFTFLEIFLTIDCFNISVIVLLITISVFLSALAFSLLIKSMGYEFPLSAGYHGLNLSQLAALMPGRIWGFAGLIGFLIMHGISKTDCIFIIFLHTLFMLSSAVIIGSIGLSSYIGWKLTLLCLAPLIILFLSYPKLDKWKLRFFPNTSALPGFWNMLLILSVGIISWIIVSASFAYLFFSLYDNFKNPLFIASSFSAGYVGGFLSLITPYGLGVREGIITVLLSSEFNKDQTLALAILFRVIHTAILFINVGITLVCLQIQKYSLKKIKKKSI